MKTWQVIDAVVTKEAREAAEYGLMEAGAAGTETVESGNRPLTITAYFDGASPIESARASVLDALRIYECPPGLLIEIVTREIADEDWLAEWKEHWQPVEIGRSSPGGWLPSSLVISRRRLATRLWRAGRGAFMGC